MKMDSAKENAKAMLEAIKNPERFCPVCWKRLGVCKHTKLFKQRNLQRGGGEE